MSDSNNLISTTLNRLKESKTWVSTQNLSFLEKFLTGHSEQKTTHDILNLINRHVDNTELELFKYSTLPIHLPENEGQLNNLYFLKQIFFSRTEATDSLAKFGVSFHLSYNQDRKTATLAMEDLKGRFTPLVRLEDIQTNKINFGNEGSLPFLTLHGELNTEKFVFNSPELENSDAGRGLKKLFSNAAFFTEHIENLDKHKNFFFCSKEGVLFPGATSKKIPLLANISHRSTVAQMNKISPAILKQLSNGTRFGPTINTIQSAYVKLIEDIRQTTNSPTDLSKILLDTNDRLTKKTKKVDKVTENYMFKTIANSSYSEKNKVAILTKALISSGCAMKIEGVDSRQLKHSPIEFSKQNNKSYEPRPPKGKPLSEMPKSTPQNIESTMDIFNRYHDQLTTEQLAMKLIDSVSQSKTIIPFSIDDIKKINSFVGTMQEMPSTAKNGLAWLSDIVREKEMSMLQVEPSSPGETRQKSAPSNRVAPKCN